MHLKVDWRVPHFQLEAIYLLRAEAKSQVITINTLH